MTIETQVADVYLRGLAQALQEQRVAVTETVAGFDVSRKNQGTRYRVITGTAFKHSQGTVDISLFTHNHSMRISGGAMQSSRTLLQSFTYYGPVEQAPSYGAILEKLDVYGLDQESPSSRPAETDERSPHGSRSSPTRGNYRKF